MVAFGTEQLEKWTRGRWFRGPVPARLGDIAFDSRSLSSGGIFIALRTGKRDGHEFLAAAAEAGAAAAIVEREDMRVDIPQLLVEDTLDALHCIAAEMRKRFSGSVLGVTGSCGKTSTKDLLALLLGDEVMSTQGNYNNFIGMPLTLTRLLPGTHSAAVVELGISQQGEMKPLAKILKPDIGIVTSIAPAHLEGLGSLEGVAEEKAGLFANIGRDGRVYFPSFCLQWEPFCELRARCRVTASMDEDTPVLPGPNYELVRFQTFQSAASSRTEMLLFMPGADSFTRFILPCTSVGMRSNAALALSVALDMGVPVEALRERMLSWQPASMRGEVRRIGKNDFYVDCYNANPASMLDSVQLFRGRFPKEPRLFMLGCMNELGAESASLHRLLGLRIGAETGESFCVVGTDAESLSGGLIDAGADASRVHICKDPADAMRVLESFCHGSGAVLLKGSRSYRMEEYLPNPDTEKTTTC